MAVLNISIAADSVKNTQLVSYEATVIFMWVVLTVVCQALSLFGIATNAINIVCFVKQGFKDPINISLLGLSVSDLCSLIALSWINVCYTPAFSTADLPFHPKETSYLTGGVPHIAFSRVTSWITAIITLERCLCVIFPLQVKQLITRRRMAFIIITLFITLLVCEAPVYTVMKLQRKFFPEKNQTIFGIISTPNRLQVETISFTINNFFLPLVSFIVIIVCTAILVITLQNQTKWRNKTSNQRDLRNESVAKMVVMISVLFISCYIPLSILVLIVVALPDFNIGGKSDNVSIFLGGIGFVFECINSSSNIFIYYRMSVKYRNTFRMIFRKEFKF